VSNSGFLDYTAVSFGGGNPSKLTLPRSGGGSYATLSVSNSTISNNTATLRGGGIFIQSVVVATSRGIVFSAHLDLTFSTMYDNTSHDGGDIAIEDVSSPQNVYIKPSKQLSQVTIRNSIIADNPAHPGPDIVGMLTSYGYNLFQDNSGATFDPATNKQHNTDRTLSVNDQSTLFAAPVGLRNNGGPTKTLMLAPDSPAVDQIPLDACQINNITTDQRGMKRPDEQESACDIGAYEYQDTPT
jgi:hypothetical protein